MRSLVYPLLAGVAFLSFLTGCRTAEDATATGLGVGAHAADKTGRVLAHGARKVENL